MAAIVREEDPSPGLAEVKAPGLRPPRRAPKIHAPDVAELAIRDLLRPGVTRITVEPIRRLSDDAVLVYDVRWRVPRLDAVPSVEDIWEAAQAADLHLTLHDTLLRAELEVARQLLPGSVLLGMDHWRRRRPGVLSWLGAEVKLAGLEPGQIVWQLVDQEEPGGLAPLHEFSAELHGRGFRVALGRLGVARTRLAAIGQANPDLMQMDAVLIDGLEKDRGQRAVVSALVGFAHEMDSYLVAGGIAQASELSALIELGVQFGQGPLLGEPRVATGPGAEEPAQEGKPVLSLTEPPAAPGVGSPSSRPARAATAQTRGSRGDARQLEVAEILSQAARALQAEHDPTTILELAADYLERLVAADGLSVYAADWDAGRFRPVLARSLKDPTYPPGVMSYSFSLGTGLTGWAFDLGVPQRVNDADAHPAAGHVPGTVNDDESLLLIPLVAGDYRLGMLNMVRFSKDAFVAYDLTLASLMAHMAAAAWRNAQLYAEQVQHAITDSLTGLLNTRWLRDAARRELAMAERSGTPLAVVMLDLDNFKHINDSCGHAAGDAILRHVGRVLQGAVRAEDASVRYGGEEFVLMLRDCGLEGARRIAREVRKGLAVIPLPQESTVPVVTASLGIALFPKHGRTLSQLLSVADAAMYLAKRRGRDRVALGH
ncbi:MAG: diguanylate cyclase [Candidatus Dormibacteria bacterium]